MSSQSQNLIALLTSPGMAGVATVRLSGAIVPQFAKSHLSKPPKLGRPVHCELRDGESLVDDPVAVLVDESTLDLSLHGGTWIVQRMIDLATGFGFRLVDASELPADVEDAIEAQVLRDLPRALTKEAISILLAQPAVWQRMMAENDPLAKAQATADRSLHWLLNPPTVAIVGIPNVGKSTLANQLFSREYSIMADMPGTTRDWVGERANIDGLVVTLIDTPGVRETTDAIEAEAIGISQAVVNRADLVIELFDVTQSRELQPRRFAESICVSNKVDARKLWSDDSMIQIIATAGHGIAQLREQILARFGCSDLSSLYARVWTETQRTLIN